MIVHIFLIMLFILLTDIFCFRNYKKNILDNFFFIIFLIITLLLYSNFFITENIELLLTFFLLFIINFKLIFTGIKNLK